MKNRFFCIKFSIFHWKIFRFWKCSDFFRKCQFFSIFIFQNYFFHRKNKLRKKSQYSSYVKFPQESISDVFRTIRARQTRFRRKYTFFLDLKSEESHLMKSSEMSIDRRKALADSQRFCFKNVKHKNVFENNLHVYPLKPTTFFSTEHLVWSICDFCTLKIIPSASFRCSCWKASPLCVPSRMRLFQTSICIQPTRGW